MSSTRGKKAENVPIELPVVSDKENGDSKEEFTSNQELGTSRGKTLSNSESGKWSKLNHTNLG